MRKEVLYISDILDITGTMMDHVAINRTYNTTLTFLYLLRIRLTIPHDWKEILAGNIPENLEVDLTYNRLKNLKNLKTKYLYDLLIETEHECNEPTNAHLYWQNKYTITDDTMKSVYMLPYRVTKLTTLQALQYKLLNKIINCNYWLHKIKIIDSPICRYCEKEETIEHFFIDCAITKQFWHAFLTWWKAAGNIYPDILEENDIILGYKPLENKEITLNCCILIGKKMIYEQKNYHKKQPDLYKYHCDLKNVIEVERHICTKNSTLTDFYST